MRAYLSRKNILIATAAILVLGIAGYIQFKEKFAPLSAGALKKDMKEQTLPGGLRISFEPIGAEFLFPVKASVWKIGEKKEILWHMPKGNTDYTVYLELINSEGKALGYLIDWNWVKEQPVETADWDAKTLYTMEIIGKTEDGKYNVQDLKLNSRAAVPPGTYTLRLHYEYAKSKGGEKGSFESEPFQIVQ